MQTGIEPEIREFLMKVLQTVTAMVVWAIITMFFGLYLEWALIHGSFNILNGIFYSWFVLSLAALIYFFVRVWRK